MANSQPAVRVRSIGNHGRGEGAQAAVIKIGPGYGKTYKGSRPKGGSR